MAIGDQRVLVWPFTLSGDLVYADDSIGTTTTTETFSDPDGFIVHENGATIPSGLSNLATAFETSLKSGHAAVYGSSATWTVTLDDAGHMEVTNPNADDLWILPGHVSTTVDPTSFGLAPSAPTQLTGLTTTTLIYQAAGQWFPDRPHSDDTGERARHVIVTSPPTLTGVQSVVCHSDIDLPAYYRMISWDDLHHARMFQSAADDATASTIAGVEQGDPNVPFESLVRYWIDNTQPAPQRVYVRDTVTDTTLAGPYQLAMLNSAVSDGGVARSWQRSDLRQRRFRCGVELVREGS